MKDTTTARLLVSSANTDNIVVSGKSSNVNIQSGVVGTATVNVATRTTSYTSLTQKPSINGIILNGNLTTSQLGIIEDESVTDAATWSSQQIAKKIKEETVVKELIGTVDAPIIASDLALRSYILSGWIQSSRENVTLFNAPRKCYSVFRQTEDDTILWEDNQYTLSRYYIVFSHIQGIDPIQNSVELITKKDLETWNIDGGNFSTEEK